jgi:acetyl esterase
MKPGRADGHRRKRPPLAPEYRELLATLAENPPPPVTELTPAQARALYRGLRPACPGIAVGSIEERALVGPEGPIGLRIYRPALAGSSGIFVCFHGGGWVIGDLDTADGVCRQLANAAGCIVASVDYRLAPEHPYPAAVLDAYAATSWVADHGAALGGNGKLAVGGESAGGNLAAAVALKARDEGGPRIDLQLLAYPVVDHDLTRQSCVDNARGPILETEALRWFWDHYCPDPARRDEPYAAPLRARSHAGLPPALVLVAELDPLLDEGEAYARKLAEAGVPATLHRHAGLVHDFLATAHLLEVSRAALERAAAGLRAALS